MITFGERITELRKKLGLSQVEIASMLKTTQTAINRYENNQAEPRFKTILWYADYFDVSLDYIFGRIDNPKGATYEYKPNVLKEKMENKEEWEKFVKACFEPNSALNLQLQEAILRMSTEQ